MSTLRVTFVHCIAAFNDDAWLLGSILTGSFLGTSLRPTAPELPALTPPPPLDTHPQKRNPHSSDGPDICRDGHGPEGGPPGIVSGSG
ncbi:hypothetical protein DPEC_G00086860 [Dallia pectoralis]|uniref:Uncharacterized protein n=1 Tax=Dallia pectoralis TaxID=75939 RepID=A0ACC2GZZ5_DALPE|nr:hypothetical protein DPEC_G00086860 [Dallia pectoralis]